MRSSIIKSFAMGAQVAESDVTLEVTAASVILSVSIASPTRAAAQSVQSTLTPLLSSTANAALFMPPGMTVETVPEIEVTERGSSSSADDDALPLGPLAGGAAGALVFAACTIAVYCALRRKAKKLNLGPGGVPSHPPILGANADRAAVQMGRNPVDGWRRSSNVSTTSSMEQEKVIVEKRSPKSALSTPRSAACTPGALSSERASRASSRLNELRLPAQRQELAQQRSLQSDRIDERMDSSSSGRRLQLGITTGVEKELKRVAALKEQGAEETDPTIPAPVGPASEAAPAAVSAAPAPAPAAARAEGEAGSTRTPASGQGFGSPRRLPNPTVETDRPDRGPQLVF